MQDLLCVEANQNSSIYVLTNVGTLHSHRFIPSLGALLLHTEGKLLMF